MGYRDYYSMSLANDELDETWLFALGDSLAAKTDALFASEKARLDRSLAARFGVEPEQIGPWHYSDPFFQRAPADDSVDLDPIFRDKDLPGLARRFYDGIGMDVGDILSRSDLYERPGKYQHAYCEDMDREGDIRVICNLRDNHDWMSTLLHELGHGVYFNYIDPRLPYLLREHAHLLTTEAVAMVMGNQTYDARWLTKIAGVSEARARELEAAAARASALESLIFIRWCLVMINFERALYANPRRNLNALWWQLVSRYQMVLPPAGRNEPDWAAKIHMALYPVYYQNYMLGQLLSMQIQSAITRRFGTKSVTDMPEAGQWLIDSVLGPGEARLMVHPDFDTVKLEREMLSIAEERLTAGSAPQPTPSTGQSWGRNASFTNRGRRSGDGSDTYILTLIDDPPAREFSRRGASTIWKGITKAHTRSRATTDPPSLAAGGSCACPSSISRLRMTLADAPAETAATAQVGSALRRGLTMVRRSLPYRANPAPEARAAISSHAISWAIPSSRPATHTSGLTKKSALAAVGSQFHARSLLLMCASSCASANRKSSRRAEFSRSEGTTTTYPFDRRRIIGTDAQSATTTSGRALIPIFPQSSAITSSSSPSRTGTERAAIERDLPSATKMLAAIAAAPTIQRAITGRLSRINRSARVGRSAAKRCDTTRARTVLARGSQARSI